jgi:hypothetical protein
MGHLSQPQIIVLALWSYGIVIARSCGLTSVAATLACHLDQKEDNLRQRLREWCWNREAKQGKQRVDWEVSQSFAPLVKWILSIWSTQQRQIVLAMDATSLKQVFVVLSISVVYRQCAIPIAWTILREGQKGSWQAPWLGLFASLQNAFPSDWLVLVMADRGLYARWLYQAIQDCHWHPFLRINQRSKYCLKGETDFRPMSQLLSRGSVWKGEVTCFAKNSIDCTLLACWDPRHSEPWLILTDLPPQNACAEWYEMRSWIEDGFRDLKRDGWQWQKTRMTDPNRASRLWLALAVATLWVISVGGQRELEAPEKKCLSLPETHIACRTKRHITKPRHLSCFSRGLISIVVAIVKKQFVYPISMVPDPWPIKTYP